MDYLAKRVTTLNESATLLMARLAGELKAKGADVISMSLGEPDFNTPDFVKDAAKKALDDNITRYSPVPGFPKLRTAICNKYNNSYGTEYKPSNVVVSTGAKQALMNIFMSLVNPGDEIILPAPYWVSYKEMIEYNGGIPVIIETKLEDDYKISNSQLQDALSDKTKAILFTNPSNPTGTLYTKDEITGFANILEKTNSFIISDEIYDFIQFTDNYTSFSEFPGLIEKLILVNGVSKSYAMTGFRVGYSISNEVLAKTFSKVQSQFTSGTCAISQMAAITAIEEGTQWAQDKKAIFFKRRDILIDNLNKTQGIKCNRPDGAFYLFCNISALIGKKSDDVIIKDSQTFCMDLLEKANVALTAGSAFGAENHVRFSYALSEEQIIEACNRIIKWEKNLS
jgi:aspartate aminotransferase